MSKVDCKQCLSMMSSFFGCTLSPKMTLLVVEHLNKCALCKDSYKNSLRFLLGKNIDIDNIIESKREAAQRALELEVDKETQEKDKTIEESRRKERTKITKEESKEKIKSEDKDIAKLMDINKWTKFAQDKNYYRLTSIRAYMDFLLETLPTEESSDLYFGNFPDNLKEYIDFEALKMAKRIDHLELCYSKNVDSKGDNK